MPSADGITFEVTDDALRQWLDRAASKATGPERSRLLDVMGAELESRTEQRFDNKLDPSGTRWAPLAESTKLRYAKKDGKRKRGSLLERSRLMRTSLSHQVDSDSVLVGFGVAYAVYHETGTERMPRRGLLTGDPATGLLGNSDREAVLALLEANFADL